jgi:hypothetical protein
VGNDGALYDPRSYLRVTSWLKNNLVIYPRTRDILVSLLPRWEPPPPAVSFFQKDLEPGYEAKTLRFFQSLAAWAELHRIALDIVYTPFVVEASFDPVLRAAKESNVAVDQGTPFLVAKRVAAAIGAGFLDLRPFLKEEKDTGHPLTLIGEQHYGPQVSERFGRAIWAFLQNQLTTTASGGTHTDGT